MSTLRRGVDDTDWAKGPPDARVRLLEYGDFECSACGEAFWELKRLESMMGGQYLFVFRHFPLSQAHLHALQAAEAAEAAGAQDAFWEMHDALYTNQDELEVPALIAYARDIGLDVPRFVRDLQTHRHLPTVRREFVDGVRSGVNATPTFFIDGQRWNGAYTAEALLAGMQGETRPIEPLTNVPWP